MGQGQMIDGVITKPLKIFRDHRGQVIVVAKTDLLRCDRIIVRTGRRTGVPAERRVDRDPAPLGRLAQALLVLAFVAGQRVHPRCNHLVVRAQIESR